MPAVLAFLIGCNLSLSQSNSASGELRGTVSDPSGAVVPGARIIATNVETGLALTSLSDGRGEYRILLLPPGTYEVKVEMTSLVGQPMRVQITVGQTASADFRLQVRSDQTIVVTGEAPVVETQRSQQSNTISETYIRNLPLDRRDYLSFSLLAPGVSDSNRVVDNTDFRAKQTPASGLSFYGSNGRGNSITVDGAENNNFSGGVRPSLGQEAIQEFQINRSNYSAELGSASGGVINIISKSGTNEIHGKLFAYFRDQHLDAADPFALKLEEDNSLTRIKPPANRQQYGATLGMPLKKDRTFLFASFEGLKRNESAVVSVLTDFNIFQPTPQQAAIIANLAANPDTTPIPCLPAGAPLVAPAYCAAVLKAALTSRPSTVELFKSNSGVFPFITDARTFSLRFDHRVGNGHQTFLRYNYTKNDDQNRDTHALVGFSRSNNVHVLDSDVVAGWMWILNPKLFNEFRFQWNYDDYYVQSNEPYGPEFNITGYGYFNRDIFLPGLILERRYEFSDSLSFLHGKHRMKFGFSILDRTGHAENYLFMGGRFGFGDLPGNPLLSPQLQSTSITAVQAFDLGLPQSYQQGFGDPMLRFAAPYYAFYAQDSWNPRSDFTLNFGLRYELDVRNTQVPTDRNNFAPRIGFAWDPWNNKRTVVRGGFGIYYAQIYGQIDAVVTALGEINGYRQIAQVLSPLMRDKPLAPNGPINIYQTLRAQGVIGVPTSSRTIQPSDLTQFGIYVSHTGPRPPLTVLFQIDPNYRNPYSEQGSLGIEHEISSGLSASASYIFARTARIARARDLNLIPRPPGSLGISNWADPACAGAGIYSCFKDPALYQNNNYESTANAFYHGMILEISKRFGSNASLACNYTFSKAIDEVTDSNSDYQANDQTNLRAERALSAFDQRHKVVFYAYLQSPYHADPADSLAKHLLADFALTPVFRYNSARPFNLLTGVDINGDRHSTTDRPIFAGRNTGIGPDYWTFDLRLGRVIRLGGESRILELMAEAFNMFNRLNYASVNNTVGPNFSGPFHVPANPNLGPSAPLGYTSAVEARRFQLGLRFSF
ncbi:MAG: TonB-dependent receptor [Acidobacteriia bacterium]|nr:TonB-dependent receptor [Terriglobia bacterium]